MIAVGFTLIGRGAWSGGESYLRNMLSVIASELRGKVQAKLFLTPEQHSSTGASFDHMLAAPAIVDNRVTGAGLGRRGLIALSGGSDRAFADLVAAQGIDVVFEVAQWFGNRFPIPVVSWIPDFQHRRLPHLFPRSAWWRRDLGYRLQTSGNRTIMLSSGDALADCETFYPASRNKTAVVRFAINLDPGAILARADEARQAHGLPGRFFFLPNQFWVHKNHRLVIEALKHINQIGALASLPPVILSGRTTDPRDPTFFKRLMGLAETDGLGSHFRHLGLIPYDDVVALIGASDYLLNPSHFEGWSTTVEEAKSLGTPMLLSDIPLHREQAPESLFFAPDSAKALAQRLLEAGRRPRLARDSVAVLQSRQQMRRRDYAAALLALFENARGVTP
ncbi:glycosyltransferase family 1 protein [Mesorhizobium sp.]|uniref:glycosyltransferase family 4 protein n=2 Tax=Phyllobacteriaceae TaxID=69277 RepID=UPI000FE862AF|nr:glycosyltransferase family 1 protein [Mesorhizobium sp.]RWP34615.1 MAG: glycosyltransferase [Mesorhizobium sp.]